MSLELAAAASCPVAVIRPGLHPEGPVVVAVDGLGSPAALQDACTLASFWQAGLTIVHVHHTPSGYRQRDLLDAEASAGEVVSAALDRARMLAPSVRMEGRLLIDASVPHAILKASEGARMLVAGSKGHGFLRETIGSTAHAVLHHARGPVLISRRGTVASNHEGR